MLKRFLDGMVFGSGFALAFVTISFILTIWVFPLMYETRHSSGVAEETLLSPPEIRDDEGYLGSTASFSGKFIYKRKVLAQGPGEIEGRAEVNDKPAAGLKVRLALNGEVKSQWAVVGDNGRYLVSVPYGEYRVDGFDLDFESANRVLAGKIIQPGISSSSEIFTLSKEVSKGPGLNLKFVDPVRLDLAKKQFLLSEDVIVKWHPYPGAEQYRVQVLEKLNPDIHEHGELFDWGEQPIVAGTSVDLKKYSVELKSGNYYSLDIEALNEKGRVLSKTAWDGSGYDFRIE
ncbi:MAG TPA: hypothetical protein VF268_00585 [Gammaproteobacteria bacterium]